jgi:hypothetical protein
MSKSEITFDCWTCGKQHTVEFEPNDIIDAYSPELHNLPKPVGRVDLLGCLAYLVIIIAAIYWIGQGVRYALG